MIATHKMLCDASHKKKRTRFIGVVSQLFNRSKKVCCIKLASDNELQKLLLCIKFTAPLWMSDRIVPTDTLNPPVEDVLGKGSAASRQLPPLRPSVIRKDNDIAEALKLIRSNQAKEILSGSSAKHTLLESNGGKPQSSPLTEGTGELSSELRSKPAASSVASSMKHRGSLRRNGTFRLLSTVQINDLFQRLDTNGTGELELDQFLQISSKANLDCTEEHLTA
jgi:hypothetical protein